MNARFLMVAAVSVCLLGFNLASAKTPITLSYQSGQYSGEDTDQESGLQYLRHRYYNAALMRFMTLDHYKAKTNVFDNTYNYAAANPVMNADPSGQSEKPGKLLNLGKDVGQKGKGTLGTIAELTELPDAQTLSAAATVTALAEVPLAAAAADEVAVTLFNPANLKITPSGVEEIVPELSKANDVLPYNASPRRQLARQLKALRPLSKAEQIQSKARVLAVNEKINSLNLTEKDWQELGFETRAKRYQREQAALKQQRAVQVNPKFESKEDDDEEDGIPSSRDRSYAKVDLSNVNL